MLVNFSKCCETPAIADGVKDNEFFICTDCWMTCETYASAPNLKTCPECSNEITYNRCTCKESEIV